MRTTFGNFLIVRNFARWSCSVRLIRICVSDAPRNVVGTNWTAFLSGSLNQVSTFFHNCSKKATPFFSGKYCVKHFCSFAQLLYKWLGEFIPGLSRIAVYETLANLDGSKKVFMSETNRYLLPTTYVVYTDLKQWNFILFGTHNSWNVWLYTIQSIEI